MIATMSEIFEMYNRPHDLLNCFLQQRHVLAKLYLSFYNRLSYQGKNISFALKYSLEFSNIQCLNKTQVTVLPGILYCQE